MPKYNYEAFDKFGHVCKGEIEANSKEEAIGKLREGEIRETPLFIQNIEEDSTPLKTVLPVPEPPRRVAHDEEAETVVVDPNPPKPQPVPEQSHRQPKPTPEEIAAMAKQREEAVKKAAVAENKTVAAKGPRPELLPEPKPITAEELFDLARRVMAMKYPEGIFGTLGPAIKTWDYSKVTLAQSAYFMGFSMLNIENVKLQGRSLGAIDHLGREVEGPQNA